MAQTLKLNRKELTDLILETYHEVLYFGGDKPEEYLNSLRGGVKSRLIPEGGVTEQGAKELMGMINEQDYIMVGDEDGIPYIDPRYSIEDNISEYNRLKKAEKELSNFVASRYPTQYKKAKANEDSFWDYHLVLDIVAVVLYVAGALTIQFYGLGLVLELLAIFVELFNAWSYVGLDDDPDYFMAGLTASFTIFPAGNLIFKTVFRGFTKSMQAMFKSFAKGTKVTAKNILKHIGRGTLTTFQIALKKSGALKYVKKLPGWIDKGIKGMKNFRKWAADSWFFKWLVKPLDWIINKFLKILKRVVSLFLQVITEMSLYDPMVASNTLVWLGEKIGIGEITTTFGDWLVQDSPFRNKILLKYWNNRLQEAGSIEGAIETTVFDCKGGTYDMNVVVSDFLAANAQDTYLWDVEGFKKFVPNQSLYQSNKDGSPRWDIRKASRKWDGFSWGELTREIKKWWVKGWRPNVYAGITLDEDQATDETLFVQWTRFNNNAEIKNLLRAKGIASCEKFVTWIKGLTQADVGIITTLECIYNPGGFACDDDDGNMFGD